jgi:uncharacterized protein
MPYPYLTPIILLTLSNVFMTVAWYGHLKFKEQPLYLVILISWGIAFFEYCLQVPANRMGHAVYSAAELKTIQEVLSLSCFVLFNWLYLKESMTLQHFMGFAFIGFGAYMLFKA